MLTCKKSDAPVEIVGYSNSNFVDYLDIKKCTSRIYIHTCKWSYIVEKLQTNCHYIFDDVREVCCLL
jgi:hypothetical protein